MIDRRQPGGGCWSAPSNQWMLPAEDFLLDVQEIEALRKVLENPASFRSSGVGYGSCPFAHDHDW